MRRYLVLCLVAACGAGGELDVRLAARRAALGLADDPLPFPEAMARIREKGYEGLLARAGSGSMRLQPDEVLDAALEIENLLARADPATAAVRPRDPPGFDARLAHARGKASALARSVAAGGSGGKEAGELVASCLDCHVTFRIRR